MNKEYDKDDKHNSNSNDPLTTNGTIPLFSDIIMVI